MFRQQVCIIRNVQKRKAQTSVSTRSLLSKQRSIITTATATTTTTTTTTRTSLTLKQSSPLKKTTCDISKCSFSFTNDNNPSSTTTKSKATSTSTTTKEKSANEIQLCNYLEKEVGIDSKLHNGIIKALESVYGNKDTMKVDHLQSFGTLGLKALAVSVQEQLNRRNRNQQQGNDSSNNNNNNNKPQQQQKQQRRRRSSVSLLVKIPHHSTEFELEWILGDSLVDLAIDNDELLGEYMEGTCGQNMSCCTCHVYIENEEFRKLLPKPEQSEKDMLDLAYDPKESSRLGCQIKLTPELLDVPFRHEITIPGGVNNVWN